MSKSKETEPIKKAMAISLADRDLAISILTKVELEKRRMEAFDFVTSNMLRISTNDKQLYDAIGVLRGQLYKDLNFAMSHLFMFAAIDDSVREIAKKEMQKQLEEVASSFDGSLGMAGHFYEREDIEALVKAKLGIVDEEASKDISGKS